MADRPPVLRTWHFYHLHAGGAWREPVEEHAAALAEARYSGPVTVRVVGPEPDRDAAVAFLEPALTAAGCQPWWRSERVTGYEQVTLRALHEWVQRNAGEWAVLYCHTKGAFTQSPFHPVWRRSMTRHVVGEWRRCIRLLETHDTVGCHWLTPQRYPGQVSTPFYGGNFWWARASYLRSLPPPPETGRHGAEAWVGLGWPRAFDLLPGWPTDILCR